MKWLVTELATDLDTVSEIRRDFVSWQSDDPGQHRAISLNPQAL